MHTPESNRILRPRLPQMEVAAYPDGELQHLNESVLDALDGHNDHSISLPERVRMIEELGDKTVTRRIVLQTLQGRGQLKPVPELFWRVDRTLAEYHRRFGISIISLLRAMRDEDRQTTNQKVIVEFGPGNGLAKRQRGEWFEATQGFTDVSISNEFYYPLEPLFKNIIDFEALQKATGQPLSPIDIKDIVTVLYHTAMIAEGQSAQDNFEYDQVFYNDLTKDINKLIDHLPAISKKLKSAKLVPSRDSHRAPDGTISYPYKIERAKLSPAAQAALSYLEENLTKTLKPKATTGQLLSAIDAYPEGTMIADFSAIAELPLNSIDLGLAVRSTVYKTGEEYIQLMTSIAQHLTTEGIHLDDSIRDNHGRAYRLAEWIKIRELLGPAFFIHVITGPGFKREDLRAEQVPLGVIISRQPDYGQQINNIMLNQTDGYALTTLDDLITDPEYVQSLDVDQLTWQALQTT